MNKETYRKILLKRLHCIGFRLGLQHEDLHDIASQWYEAESLAKLSVEQLRDFKAELEKRLPRREHDSELVERARGLAGRKRMRGYRSCRLKNEFDNVEVLPTALDWAKLFELKDALGWDKKHLLEFAETIIHKPRILTMADLNKVKWAMKGLLRPRENRQKQSSSEISEPGHPR